MILKLKMPYKNCYHVLTNIRSNKKQKYEINQIIGVPGNFKNTSRTYLRRHTAGNKIILSTRKPLFFFQLQFIGGCAATSDKMNLNWVKGSVSFFYYSPFDIHATYLLDSIWNWNLVLGNWKLGMIIITCM